MVLYKHDGKWVLSEKKVKYIQHGEEVEQFVGEEGVQWWVEFGEKWDHTEIVGFENMEYTEAQLTRLEDIKSVNAPDNIIEDYVMEGIIGEGLEVLSIRKENEELRQLLADLTEVVLLGGVI